MPALPEVTLDSAIANWPWREGNRFALLDATEQYFERMIQAIDDAQSYILLEMYLVESGVLAGRFVEAFSRAALRGVVSVSCWTASDRWVLHRRTDDG